MLVHLEQVHKGRWFVGFQISMQEASHLCNDAMYGDFQLNNRTDVFSATVGNTGELPRASSLDCMIQKCVLNDV
jgi:hypothetical protein